LALLECEGVDMVQKYIQLEEQNVSEGVYVAKNGSGKLEFFNQQSQQFLLNDLYIKTSFLTQLLKNNEKSSFLS
jgi:hypothetical protein